MSAFDKYFLMKPDDVPSYITEKVPDFFTDAELECTEIGDGNLNYVFRVVDNKSGKSIIVKQAGEELRISKDLKLPTDRGRIEARVLNIQNELANGMAPKVYLYDDIMCAEIMEDMTGHKMMRTALINHEIFPKFADQISSFLASTLLLSSDIVMDHTEKKLLASELVNPDLCDLTEHLVFSEPYFDYNKRNNIFQPCSEFINENIYGDESLKLEVAKLKFKFMNDQQSLIHGDLHTGSIFINQEHLYVFDPEFAFYGPMGYDIGNVIANMFFALENGRATIEIANERNTFERWCIDTIINTINMFIVKYNLLFDKKVYDISAKAPGFKYEYLMTVLSDAAGYTGTEIIRRIVGMAKVKDITSIKDEDLRKNIEISLLSFAKELIMNRENIKSGNDYIELAKKHNL